jgi:transposase
MRQEAPMSRQHTVTLSPQQRRAIDAKLHSRTISHLTRVHCRTLLLADTTQSGYLTDPQIAARVGCSARSVARVRATFAANGLDAAIERKARSDQPQRCLSPEQEARVIALVLETPPHQAKRWTLRTLTNEVMAQGMVRTISQETVRKTLKKGA